MKLQPTVLAITLVPGLSGRKIQKSSQLSINRFIIHRTENPGMTALTAC